MVDKNDALFREVEEELRREQYAKLWERYGTYIIGLAIAIVAAVAGAKLWESQRLAAANAAGAEYEAAASLVASGKTEEAAKAFEALAADAPSGYAALASLSQAGAYLKLDKRAEALALFDKLADGGTSDPLLASYARLQGAALRIGEADFTEIENRLKPLADDNSPWRHLAKELIGTAALKAGKLAEARKTLEPLLTDPALTRAASERISRLMTQIARAELGGVPAPAPAAPPAPAETSPAPAGEAEKPATAP